MKRRGSKDEGKIIDIMIALIAQNPLQATPHRTNCQLEFNSDLEKWFTLSEIKIYKSIGWSKPSPSHTPTNQLPTMI